MAVRPRRRYSWKCYMPSGNNHHTKERNKLGLGEQQVKPGQIGVTNEDWSRGAHCVESPANSVMCSGRVQ
ncbi:hypothetical protein J6590_024510 [Homalodisca vitripennis]|nr:hypothetical protein J6590_024510 [Homalodisca vitripennis]